MYNLNDRIAPYAPNSTNTLQSTNEHPRLYVQIVEDKSGHHIERNLSSVEG